jgi:hypothetical protein
MSEAKAADVTATRTGPASTPRAVPKPKVVSTAAMKSLRRLHAEASAAVAAAGDGDGRVGPGSASAPAGEAARVAAPAAASPGRETSASAPVSTPSQRPAEASTGAGTDREAGLLALLKLEADARAMKSTGELALLIANEARRLTRARQVFVLHRQRDALRLVAVTALPSVDRMAPLTHTVETVARHVESEGHAAQACDFRFDAYAGAGNDTAASYPLQEAAWVPFTGRDGDLFAGMILTRETAWLERDLVIAKRLGSTFAHAWSALEATSPITGALLPRRRTLAAVAVVLSALGFVPVSLTTLAPVEIVPRDPFVVAAPIDGVIEDVPIEPNARVGEGALLVKFEDTTLRNRLEVAEREVQVAAARLKTTTQLAFVDENGRHDLAVARAELQLKTAERDFARDLLGKAEIRAPRAGLAVLGDKKELIGRPLSVGERILEIADPGLVEARIEIPVSDSIILRNGAPVKLLLDSNPLASIEAKVIASDFQARMSDAAVLSFRAIAEIDVASAARTPLRLGARGTAQIYGERVALGFYLLRRPFAKLRQWTGL